MTYKALIVEDEPIAQDIIKGYLGETPSFSLAGVCQNAMEVSEALSKEKIDLLFLDIELPKLSGMELLRTLQYPPKVIVTTAHEDYALEGYDLSVTDYLLKPISFERFMKAVNKALNELNLEKGVGQNEDKEAKASRISSEAIFVRTDDRIIKVPIDKILYLESYGNYVKIHTEERTYLSAKNLSHYVEQLQDRDFIRIHRSFVVPFSRIEALMGNQITVGEIELPVSNSYKQTLLERMGKL